MVHQWLDLYRERDDRGRDEPRYMSELFQAELVNKTVRDYRRTNTGHESQICIETLAEAWQSEQVKAEPHESFLRDLEDLFKRAIPVTIEWGVRKTTNEMNFEYLLWDQDTLGKRLAKVFTNEAQAWMNTDDQIQRELLLNAQMCIEDREYMSILSLLPSPAAYPVERSDACNCTQTKNNGEVVSWTVGNALSWTSWTLLFPAVALVSLLVLTLHETRDSFRDPNSGSRSYTWHATCISAESGESYRSDLAA
jgi:hypothetical protein